MFKEIVDDARRTPDIGRSKKLTMSTLCSGELKIVQLHNRLKKLQAYSTSLKSVAKKSRKYRGKRRKCW